MTSTLIQNSINYSEIFFGYVSDHPEDFWIYILFSFITAIIGTFLMIPFITFSLYKEGFIIIPTISTFFSLLFLNFIVADFIVASSYYMGIIQGLITGTIIFQIYKAIIKEDDGKYPFDIKEKNILTYYILVIISITILLSVLYFSVEISYIISTLLLIITLEQFILVCLGFLLFNYSNILKKFENKTFIFISIFIFFIFSSCNLYNIMDVFLFNLRYYFESVESDILDILDFFKFVFFGLTLGYYYPNVMIRDPVYGIEKNIIKPVILALIGIFSGIMFLFISRYFIPNDIKLIIGVSFLLGGIILLIIKYFDKYYILSLIFYGIIYSLFIILGLFFLVIINLIHVLIISMINSIIISMGLYDIEKDYVKNIKRCSIIVIFTLIFSILMYINPLFREIVSQVIFSIIGICVMIFLFLILLWLRIGFYHRITTSTEE
ncbi:MAG: hypothetical protein ACTSQP_15390 [Promethearchaeota archaeon]